MYEVFGSVKVWSFVTGCQLRVANFKGLYCTRRQATYVIFKGNYYFTVLCCQAFSMAELNKVRSGRQTYRTVSEKYNCIYIF